MQLAPDNPLTTILLVATIMTLLRLASVIGKPKDVRVTWNPTVNIRESLPDPVGVPAPEAAEMTRIMREQMATLRAAADSPEVQEGLRKMREDLKDMNPEGD